MRYIISLVLLCAFFCVPQPARADGSIAGTAGTLGLGVELSKPLSKTTDLRVGWGRALLNRQITSNNQLYDVTAALLLNVRFSVSNVEALLDLHHGTSPVNWTVGLIGNYNTVSATTIPLANKITYNGVVYDAASAGFVETKVFWSPLAPYVGLGLNRRWHDGQKTALVADVGAFYMRSAQVTLIPHGVIAVDPVFQKYLQALQGQLRDELAPYQLYPVVNLGVRFRL